MSGLQRNGRMDLAASSGHSGDEGLVENLLQLVE
jgi:hypothetical protein